MKVIYLGLILFCITMNIGCSGNQKTTGSIAVETKENSCIKGSRKKQEDSYLTSTLDTLLVSNKCFDDAYANNDGVAMTRAALMRADALSSWSKTVNAQLTMKTISLLRRARIIAGNNKESQMAIDELIKDVDFGSDSELAHQDNILGGVIGQIVGIAKNKRLNTYTLDSGEVQTVKLHVSASMGVIVYVEAQESSGISLTIREESEGDTNEDKELLCHDSSSHGILICRWRPQKDSTAIIIIENMGITAEPVLMITNQ